MKHNTSRLLLATLIGISVAAVSVVAGENVPFKGTAFTATTYAGPADCGYFKLTNEGAGEATHLGLFAITLNACFQPASYSVSVTLIAANGDQLFLDEAILAGTETEATDAFVITGGTGRFAGATGSGVHVINYDAPSELNTFEGTINFKKH